MHPRSTTRTIPRSAPRRRSSRCAGTVGLAAVGHVQGLAANEVPVLGYELVKGLELDGVVVVSPDEVLDGTERGARLVYVALTRAVQELTIVSAGALPGVLGLGSSDHDERDVAPVW